MATLGGLALLLGVFRAAQYGASPGKQFPSDLADRSAFHISRQCYRPQACGETPRYGIHCGEVHYCDPANPKNGLHRPSEMVVWTTIVVIHGMQDFCFLPLGFAEYAAIPRKSTIAGANGNDHG